MIPIVEQERQRVLSRHAAERIERKARRVLSVAGWGADEAGLRMALSGSTGEDVVDKRLTRDGEVGPATAHAPEDVEPIIARALTLQLTEQATTRHIDPATVTVQPTRERAMTLPMHRSAEEPSKPRPLKTPQTVQDKMPKSTMPNEDRSQVVDYLRALRTSRPLVTPKEACALVNRKLNVNIGQGSIYYYWQKAEPVASPHADIAIDPETIAPKPEAARNGVQKPAALVAPAPPPATQVAPHTNGSGAASIVGPPILQVFELSDGQLRIQLDMPADLGAALSRIGALLGARKETTT